MLAVTGLTVQGIIIIFDQYRHAEQQGQVCAICNQGFKLGIHGCGCVHHVREYHSHSICKPVICINPLQEAEQPLSVITNNCNLPYVSMHMSHSVQLHGPMPCRHKNQCIMGHMYQLSTALTNQSNDQGNEAARKHHMQEQMCLVCCGTHK